MKKILILVAIIGLITNCGPRGGKRDCYLYNVQAVLVEKYQDTEYHFVCTDVETGKTFEWEWGNSTYPDANYKKRQIGDTVHFEFIGKHRIIE